MKHFIGVLFKPCETTELLVFTPMLCATVVWHLRSGSKKPLQQVVNEGKYILTNAKLHLKQDK